MKNRKIKMRVLSFLSLLVLLLPMITLSVCASPYSFFDFVFNGGNFSLSQPGTKTDLGESSAGSAGVTITNLYLGAGGIRFFITDIQNYTITSEPLYMTSNGTGTLYYKMEELRRLSPYNEDISVKLYGAPAGTVWGCAGYYEP